MIKFGYVPPDFGVGIIIPLTKNVDGNATCKDNYRGITLSPVLSKVLEMVLMLKFEENLKSSDLQFGFKRKLIVLLQFTRCDLLLTILQVTVQR